MIPHPNTILARLREGSLLPLEIVAGLDHDAILDARDSDQDFDGRWIQCMKTVEEHWSNFAVTEEISKCVTDVRRESFLAVSRATSQHEIASYVSDDFDILVRGQLLGIEDAFLEFLWDAYDRDEIPGPSTERS